MTSYFYSRLRKMGTWAENFNILPFPVLTHCDGKSGLHLQPTKTQAMVPIMTVFLVTSFEMGRPTLKQNIWGKKTRRTAVNLGRTFLWLITYKKKGREMLFVSYFFPFTLCGKFIILLPRHFFPWYYHLWDSNVYWKSTEFSTPWTTELLGSWPFCQNTVIAGWTTLYKPS